MSGSSLGLLALAAAMVLGLTALAFAGGGAAGEASDAELDHLRLANTVLQQRLHGYEQLHAKMEAKLASCTSTTSPLSAAAAAGAQPADAKALLAAHAHWDWRSVARDLLQPWPSVTQENLASAVAACNGSAMYCARLQVHDGRLYVTDYAAIFFDRHYAPARIMPLLATLRRHPALPNLDVVVAANDEPRARAEPGDLRAWRRTCRRWGANAAPPAIFSSTVNAATMDLPWLDFAWYFPRRPHKLRTPPWSVLHPQLVEAGGKVRWEDKLEIAMHTGNVGSGWRKALAAVAERAPREVFVNELFIGDHGKITQTCKEMKLHATGGYQKHKCFMRFEDQCGYKYLLNSASIGYANKFKSLLLCGSVVLYVREGMRHKEFYEYGLLPGVHYHAVDTAAEVPAAVKWLRANDEYARAVAEAGRARMASLDEAAVTGFMAELLTQYSKRQSFRVAPQPGAVRIDCEDDLWRHYALSHGWLSGYLTQDNASCLHPPRAGAVLSPPGWGGAYAGSKPRCYASHDLGPQAQPHACDFAQPFSTAESWEPDGAWPKPHPRARREWT